MDARTTIQQIITQLNLTIRHRLFKRDLTEFNLLSSGIIY